MSCTSSHEISDLQVHAGTLQENEDFPSDAISTSPALHPAAMAPPKVALKHCSVGCNQVAECLDWGAHDLIAYGAHHQAIIYDPEARAPACK